MRKLIGRHLLAWRIRRARARWTRAMMRAIGIACEPSEIWGPSRRVDGLRAIRALERLSGRPFDPFDRVRLSVLRGQGAKAARVRHERVARERTIGRVIAIDLASGPDRAVEVEMRLVDGKPVIDNVREISLAKRKRARP